MSKLEMLIFYFFIILQTNIFCQEPEAISINDTKQLTLNNDNSFNSYFLLEYEKEKLEEGSVLVISTIPEKYDVPGFIYTSFEEKNPSADKRQFSCQTLGNNNLYINSSKLKQNSKLYINIHSLKEAKVELKVALNTKIYISLKEKKINFKLSDISKIYFSPKEIESSKIVFYGLGEKAKYFNMKVEYGVDDEIKEEYKLTQKYENGYGTIVDLSKIDKKETSIFVLTLTSKENYEETKVEVGFDYADQVDNHIIEVNALEHVYGAAEESQNCYSIKNLTEGKNVSMLLNVYTQDITFTLYVNETKNYSLDIFNNYFLKIPKEISIEGSYFCFKKFTRKERVVEELGPISYDFQIYYEDELHKSQSYIMPLINGKVYTHTLNSGQIFIYRQNTNTEANKENIYSANLLTIRGKPKMYGYRCKTYPECNLDEKMFNELKENKKLDVIKGFNQYFINKKQIDIKNNESISENREQYLTVVKCESTLDYPNLGECKYTIEINNELDEIQLAPEIVYATSVISPENRFLIRVSDYMNNMTNFNIFFTILTGNADIYLYEDENYKKLITGYNYRHVHRKEIIEITEDFKENYYIKVIATEPSFIILKYETDFYYRGYTMMDPNEINIEYVNKNNSFMPFVIQNPDYFYPTNNTKNNDFYFTIKTLDCQMIYKYNFIDFNNITSIHHEVKTKDINFGTSYAFSLMVGNYLHTIESDKEDCAMIIYTGEKSQDIPLLIISDMPHPSNFNDTYYIYPFIYNSDFSGVFVDIKFDYELLTKAENSPSVEVTFKIGNQENDFAKYNIKKDYTFFISKEEAIQYCSFNLQCSLTIEIKKKDGKETPYIITTSVYNAQKSPEYIYKNKVYNYKLLPNGSKYFYTQIDLNEEGEINFMFNKGNAKIYSKIVEKGKNEDITNWNKRVLLPESDDKNLLNYNSKYGQIKYNKENTAQCKNGCELYIQIKSEEKANKETEFTDVSFNINDKKVNNVEIKLNEYIKGKLEKGSNNYYNVLIPEDYRQISINLYSKYGIAKIKINEHQSNDEKDWELIPTDNFGRIIIKCDDEKIKLNSLKGVSFTIDISSNENLPKDENSDDLYYYLEIQGLYNNEKAYYNLNSERSIICNTEKDNFCYALLYLNHYYSNQSIIYASTFSSFDTINIYSNIKTPKDLEEKSFSDSIQDLFPTKEKNDQSSSNESFLLLDSTKIKEKSDYYVLLTIDCGKKNSLIKLVVSGTDTSAALLPYNADRLLLLNKNKKEFSILDKENENTLFIRSLKGISNINVNNANYKVDGINYIQFKQESFQINSEEESIILLNYEKGNKNKVYELDLNHNTEINYQLNGECFPQYTYNSLNNKNFQINISFTEIESDKKSQEDSFDITVYVVNEKRLKSLLLNPKQDMTDEKICGTYIKEDKIGIINIPHEKIKDDDNYFAFIIVDKNSENKNTYKKMKIQYKIGQKQDEKKEEEDKGGIGWIVILSIILVVCIVLIVLLLIYKKQRLQNIDKTEEEVNKIDVALNEQENS